MGIKETLIELIKTPSYVDGNNNEEKITKLIEDTLANSLYEIERQQVEGKRNNLIIKGKVWPKVILFGHTDTVLPKNKTQLSPVEKDDKIYGLGSVDMKAGIAIALDALEKFPPESGLCVILTVDEEYDFKGARKLIEKYKFSPKYLLNLEPTDLKIMTGCRGVCEFSFETIGKSAHAGRKDEGINSIEATYEIYKKLEETLDSLNKQSEAKMGLNIAYINGGIKMENEVKYMGNVVPDYVKTAAEIRIGNNLITKELIEESITKGAEKLNVKIENFMFKFFLGSLNTPKEKVRGFEKSLKNCGLNAEYGNLNKSGYYEVQMLAESWGNPTTIIFGPGPNSKSHTEDEYVEISSLYKASEVISDFLNKVL